MYVSLGQEGPPAAPRVGRVSSGGLCEFHHQWSGGREQQPAYRTVPYFASAVSYYLLQTSAFPFLLLQTSLLDWYLRGVLLLPVLGGRWGKTRRLGGSPSAGSSRQPGKASRRGGCKGSHNRWNKPQERPLSYSKFCCFFLLVVAGGGGEEAEPTSAARSCCLAPLFPFGGVGCGGCGWLVSWSKFSGKSNGTCTSIQMDSMKLSSNLNSSQYSTIHFSEGAHFLVTHSGAGVVLSYAL